jgi:hypothetical protein
MTIASDTFWSNITLGILAAMFIIAIAPYLFRLFLPTHTDVLLPQSVKELIARYVYGTVAILVGGGLAVTLAGLWWVALVYLAMAAGCGAIVTLRYFTTDVARNKQQNEIQRQQNPNLKDD